MLARGAGSCPTSIKAGGNIPVANNSSKSGRAAGAMSIYTKGCHSLQKTLQSCKPKPTTGTTIKRGSVGYSSVSMFDLLPPEIKINIFKHLNPAEVIVIAGVCTEWRDIIHKEPTSHFLWREIYETMFGGPRNNEITWKKACLDIVTEMKKRFRADYRPDTAVDAQTAGLKLCWSSRYGHHKMAAKLLNTWAKEIINGWYLQQESQLLASSLFLAAQEGQVRVLNLLLSYGASVNSAAEDDGSTPLLIATQGQHKEAVEILLSSGADPNATRGDGVTPLYIACQNGYTELVEPLLKYKADVTLPVIADGATPLFISSQNGHWAAVNYLLQYGAQPDIPRTDGVTPLFIAAQNGHKEVVEGLLTRADVNNATFHGATALFIACFKGNTDVVRLLLSRRANVNAPCDDGATPLYIAAKNGRPDIVQLLLQSPLVDINSTYHDGSTPMMAAAEKGDLQIVRMLVERNADTNRERVDGHTAYSLAAQNKFVDIVAFLQPTVALPATVAAQPAEEDADRMDVDP